MERREAGMGVLLFGARFRCAHSEQVDRKQQDRLYEHMEKWYIACDLRTQLSFSKTRVIVFHALFVSDCPSLHKHIQSYPLLRTKYHQSSGASQFALFILKTPLTV